MFFDCYVGAEGTINYTDLLSTVVDGQTVMFFDGYVSLESTMNCTVVLLPIGNQEDDFDCYASVEGTTNCI